MHDYQIEDLERQHHQLEKEIGKMEKHPHAEQTRLQDLKKRKLAIRDELVRLRKEDYEERQRVNFDDEDY